MTGIRMRGTFAVICFMLCFIGVADASDSKATLDLSAHKGKVLVVDFWASWCVPCRRSFPWLDEMQAKYGDQGLVIIAINEDDSSADATDFLQSYPVRFEIIRDADGRLAQEFDVVAMPSSYIFDREGELVGRHLGFKARLMDEYEAIIRETLNGAAMQPESVAATE